MNMKKVIQFSVVILFIIAMGTNKSAGQDPQENFLFQPNTQNNEDIELFNGHNLDGCILLFKIVGGTRILKMFLRFRME